jgi:hypothetical protein
MNGCQKNVYSFGPKAIVHAKDSKFEKIELGCVESVSQSSIIFERCIVENSECCAVKATSSSQISMNDCSFSNCNTKVVVATGKSNVTMVGCNFTSMSGNGFDFNDSSTGILENISFKRCSGIGVQLTSSKLKIQSSRMSTVLLNGIFCKQDSSVDAEDCIFEFINGYAIAYETDQGNVIEIANSSAEVGILMSNCYLGK